MINIGLQIMKQISLALLMSVAIFGCCKAQTVVNQKSGGSATIVTAGAKKICTIIINKNEYIMHGCDFTIPLNNPQITQAGDATTLTFEQWVGSATTGNIIIEPGNCYVGPDGICK
jgi:hypothetical protein